MESRGEKRRERARAKRKKPPKAPKGPPKRSRTYHCLVAAGVIPPQEDRRYTRRKDYVPPAASPPPDPAQLASATLAESGSPPTPEEATLPIKPPPPKLRISLAKLVKKRELCALLLPVLEELKNRLSHPAETYVPDDHPERPQRAFHASPAMIRIVAGGNQAGKSFSVAQEIRMWLTGDHPYQEVPRAAKIYLISSSYRTIQEGVWRHLKDCIPGWRIEAKGPNIPGGWQIPTWVRMREGAQIDFISGEGREDARKKIQAAALHLFVIDEEVDELLWKECQVRLLRHGGRVVIAATFVRSEPWILDLEDRAEAGDKDIDIFRSSTYRARDCGHVDAKVVQFLESSYSEEERQVRLLGRTRRSEGLVYPTFGKSHICEPFEVPRSWTRYCAIDPGFRTCAVIWAAVSPSNHYVVYREMYYHGKDFDEVLRGVLVAEGYEQNALDTSLWIFREGKTEDLAHRWIDPSAFSHHTTGALGWGVLLAQTSHRLGVGTRLTAAPARNDVVPGIEAIRRDLMEGIGGTPRLRIFSSCSNLIRELRNYRWKQSSGGPRTQDPKDAPVKKDDHGADCLRYLSNMGLTYRKPLDPWLTGNREDLISIGAATSMDDRWREHWRRIYERQRDGAERTEAHPSGIGSEY